MNLLLPTDQKTVTEVVCGHFNLPLEEFESNSRKREIVEARYITWHLLMKIRGTNYGSLARAFKWHEDSIRYGMRTLPAWLATDTKLAETVAVIESRCKLILEVV